MYEDDYEFLSDSDRQLKEHVKNEIGIYEKGTYDTLLAKYPNEEDLIIYRGINFKSRLEYYRFMKNLEKNNGWIQDNSASSYTRSKATATGFAETTKTYYPTQEIIQAEAKRSKEGDTLSGYCGVVLKTKIKKGEAVDVNLSEFGIEDEILMEPQRKVDVEVEVINSLKFQVNQSDFDINEYIQNCNNTSDPLFQYITINKPERINNDSANHIFEMCLSSKEKNAKIIEKRLDLNNNEELIFAGDYLTVIKERTLKSYKDDTVIHNYNFYTPNLLQTFEKRGCFRPEQYEKLKNISNELISDTLEVYLNEGQNININHLENVSWFVKFASSYSRELYESTILKRKGREYNDLSDNLRERMNDKNLSNQEKQDMINNVKDDLASILQKICDEKVGNINRKSKRLSGNKK
tara:strand:+ start:27286 stop:28509 length:1224 start_codon:yes stop_codon:yes gene_type:complete